MLKLKPGKPNHATVVAYLAWIQGADLLSEAEAAGGFLASDRILYGRAPSGDDETLLLAWPGTGIEVRTHDEDAGDSVFEIRIRNTNPAGGPSFWVVTPGAGAGAAEPGDNDKHGSLLGTDVLLSENKNGSQGRLMRLSCFANVISGDDDGFIQCMGITAGP